MKVTIEEEKESYKDSKYPLLMKSESSGLVILMTSECTGVVIFGSNTYKKVEYISDKWFMKSLVPLKGKVILEND